MKTMFLYLFFYQHLDTQSLKSAPYSFILKFYKPQITPSKSSFSLASFTSPVVQLEAQQERTMGQPYPLHAF